MIDNNKHDPEWDDAQAIWAAGKVDIPAERDAECNHFLSDLKLAAGMFTEATRVTAVNQEREWSLDDGAELCRELLKFLYRVDDVEIRRIARTSELVIEPLLERTFSDLGQLEYVLRNTPKPPKVRKRKHDIDDLLITRLADTFERQTGCKPSVTTDWDTSKRGGIFVDFVMEFVVRMLPEHVGQIDGRVIQRALERRKKLWSLDPLAS